MAFNVKRHLGTVGTANPIALHAEHLVWPVAFKAVEVVQQAVGVVGYLEVPLGKGLFGNRRVATLTETLNYLLVS